MLRPSPRPGETFWFSAQPCQARLNTSHTHIGRTLFIGRMGLGVPAGNEKLPVTHTRRGFYFGDDPMREYNDYVARVAVCEQRAKDARTESEKQSWLVMADSWRETAKLQNVRQAEFIHKVKCNVPQGHSMWIDTISTNQLVTCPYCGEPMHFAAVPKVSDLPEMQTFEVQSCGYGRASGWHYGRWHYGNGIAVGLQTAKPSAAERWPTHPVALSTGISVLISLVAFP
jgi:hypothetical protein